MHQVHYYPVVQSNLQGQAHSPRRRVLDNCRTPWRLGQIINWAVNASYLSQCKAENVGTSTRQELWERQGPYVLPKLSLPRSLQSDRQPTIETSPHAEQQASCKIAPVCCMAPVQSPQEESDFVSNIVRGWAEKSVKTMRLDGSERKFLF